MRKLIMCLGLPGSGKTTWAQKQKDDLEKIGVQCAIVCKDDIRAELEKTGWRWSRENEAEVLNIRDHCIREAFARGASVVISADTNFGKHKHTLDGLARAQKADFIVQDFTNVPLATCIERDSKREKSVGEDVIKSMYNKYLAVAADTVSYVPNPEKPTAIICDLDGTLALHEGLRSPFDYSKVGLDKLNTPIAEIVRKFKDGVIYCSGREASCYNETQEWIKTHNLPAGPLFMRRAGDYRKDYVVKQELFDKHIRDHYNILFVLDDRTQVVKLWRRLGLTCLQVAEGAF